MSGKTEDAISQLIQGSKRLPESSHRYEDCRTLSFLKLNSTTAFEGAETAERTPSREEPVVLPEPQLRCSCAVQRKVTPGSIHKPIKRPKSHLIPPLSECPFLPENVAFSCLLFPIVPPDWLGRSIKVQKLGTRSPLLATYLCSVQVGRKLL